MVRQQVAKLALRGGLLLALMGLTSCSPIALLDIIKGLAARDALGPIQEVLIAAGGDSYQMGDVLVMPFTVTTQSISTNFYISKYEITHAQFKQFIDDAGYTTKAYWTTNGWNWLAGSLVSQPDNWTNASYNASNQPVTGVSWYEAVAFCNWRSVKEYLTPAYDATGKANLAATGYRLPTEVEWEYAAAKGAPGVAERNFAYGDSLDGNKSVVVASSPAPVGSKSAAGGDTPQGLADMSGNAAEWCSDNYDMMVAVQSGTDRYYYVGDEYGAINRQAVARGGSYQTMTPDQETRCAYRFGMWVSDHPIAAGAYIMGFRTVRR